LLRTRLTELFDLKYPIMSAPMTAHSGGTLAGAVSAAGALGSFGGINAGGPAWLRDQIAIVRKQTDRPFGVGFITHWMHLAGPIFDAVLEEGVPIVAFSFVDPAPYSERAKKAGATVVCQVQTMEAAQQAMDGGADILVTQGNEAGGHTGVMGLLPLLSKVREAYPETPVLAAGGIGDGRVLAAVLAAGADGAWMGTPLLATNEAIEVTDHQKQRIVEANAEDSVYTSVYDMLDEKAWGYPSWPKGIAARVLRNDVTSRWHGHEDDLREHIDEAVAEFTRGIETDITRWRPLFAGPSAGPVKAVRPAADVIAEICDAAERILRERSHQLLA
jgi:nitronate monooxygenase